MKLLGSKLVVPELSDRIIFRPRLIKKLKSELDRFLYLLVAPAGYGKSTLAIQFMRYMKSPKCAWYYLDNTDKDPLRFINYLVGALDNLVPGLLQSGILDMLLTKKHTDLIDELCYWIEKNRNHLGWLAIDNWEIVNNESEHNEIIKRLIHSSKGRLNIIITSRVKPAFKFRKLQAKNACAIIEKEELAFTFMEFSEANKVYSNKNFDDKHLEEIWKKTEGWCVAAGFQSSPNVKRKSTFDSVLPETSDSEAFAEYVQEEILREIRSDLIEFLVKCSVLDIISPESAKSISDSTKVEDLLKRLSNTSIPFVVLEQPYHFRLHPLIRDSLSRILHQKFVKTELVKIYFSAAEYYRKNGAVIDAIDLLLANQNYETALVFMEEDWLKILAANGLGRARQWLNEFPHSFTANPRFLYIKAQIFSALGQNRQLVDFLEGRLKPENFKDNIGILGNLWIYYHWSLLHLDKVPDYKAIKKEWRELNRKYGPFSKSIEAGVNLTISLAAYQNLEYKTASNHARKCLELLEDKQFDYRMTVLNNLAMYRHHFGGTSESLCELKEILEECRRNSSYAIVPMVLVNIAELNLSQAQFSDALSNIDDAFDVMEKYNIQNIGVIMYAERLRGLAYWYTGEHERGLEHLDKSYMAASEYNEQERSHNQMLIDFYNLLDNKSRIHSKAKRGKPNHYGERFLLEHTVKAAKFLGQANWPLFIKEAENLLSITRKYKIPHWQITALLYLSLGAFNQDHKKGGKEFLLQALKILEKYNLSFYPMADELVSSSAIVNAVRYNYSPQAIKRLMSTDYRIDLAPELLRHLKDADITNIQIQNLIEFAVDNNVRGLSSGLEEHKGSRSKKTALLIGKYLKWSDSAPLLPIKIRTFGSFTMTANNRPVTFRRSKSRQLLQLLIINELKPIHEEVIMETLWPESDPAKGKSSLHTCIRDIRKSLDPYYNSEMATYICYGDQHYSLTLPENSFIDVLKLVSVLKRYLSFKESLTIDKEQEIKQTMNIYQGEFLPEMRFEPYAVEFRERLNNDFLRVTLSFAKYLIDQSRLREAEKLLLRGMMIDPLWGEGIELLMLTYAEAGELFKTLQVYRKYESRMNDELGLDPDDSIKSQFNRLMSGKLMANK